MISDHFDMSIEIQPPKKKRQPKVGVYVEIVAYGTNVGAHQIVAQYDVPVSRAEELTKLIAANPKLFKPRKD